MKLLRGLAKAIWVEETRTYDSDSKFLFLLLNILKYVLPII